MAMRRIVDAFIVTSESGEEIALINAATIEEVKEEMRDEYGMDGGFFVRRLTQEEMNARTVNADPVITPELYY